ncbi:GCG_CRPN prefix-to-repeats domain-containing protein [Legionella micdadei]|uniref:Uncharacterized protein n=1 Tax=Legionella micdadei TaxID=451 RepID=A0A098GFE6_LEGMI|nr:hypothetical protein [Legionella micdadei]ARG97707.1 hypothetical protein B6N58_08550 [Legionella micdadei]KTD27803.1 hypothetical protein Lmic_2123 [Legionella micdadei]NSL17786.1 hypothetical protein [Legionella micdadei]CEG60710.1 conserved exported protein of unknown function [Legionella micdadei]SCY10747.1 hypothetical protein SAMN02982997_00825 [Legionella micdadei]
MRAHSITLSGLVRMVAMVGLLCIAASYTSNANAAQGCGFGYHQSFYGGCVANHPGPFARRVAGRPGCWTNLWGQFRCY